MTIDCVIVGCGRIFSKHVQAIESLAGELKVVGIVEPDENRASYASNHFKCAKYTSVEQFCKTERADLAIILTPSGLHAEHIKVICKSVNTILVEKPACLSLADLDDLSSLNFQGKKIFVVKQNRYNRPIVELKHWCDLENLQSFIYGTIRLRWCRDENYYNQDTWRGTWAYDGGVLTNQASHHIDILQMFMGEVDEVYATSIYGEPSIEVENTALVNLQFKNGALGMIEASNAIRPKNIEASLSLVFQDGVAEIGGHALNEWVIKPSKVEKLMVTPKFDNFLNEKDTTDVYGSGHIPLYKDLLNFFHGNSHNLVDIVEGGKSVKLLHAIYESIETRLPVKLSGNFSNSKLGKTIL